MPNMSDEWQIKNQENKRKWFLGNDLAISFINQLFFCVELWDDLIDKDEEITDERINQAFAMLMFGLPSNDFFIANRAYLLPLILQSINGFFDSNKMASAPDKKLRNLAFHVRNLGTEVQIATAYIVGGYDHMRKVSEEIREFFAFEDFDSWDLKNDRSN